MGGKLWKWEGGGGINIYGTKLSMRRRMKCVKAAQDTAQYD